MDESALTVIVVAAVMAIFIVAVVAAIVVASRRQRDALRRISEGSGAEGTPESGEGTLDGRGFRYLFYPGGRNSPSSYTVTVDCAADRRLGVRREGALERFFKRLGLAVESQTGDRPFDEAFYLNLDDAELVRNWLHDSRQREAIQALFELGVRRLELGAQGLQAEWRPFRPERDGDAQLVPRAVAALAEIAPALERLAVGPRRGRGRAVAAALFAYGLPVAAATGGVAAVMAAHHWFRPLRWLPLFLDVLPAALAALLLFTVIATRLLRGRANSHIEWMIAVTLAVGGSGLGAVGGAALANGWFDTGAAEVVAPRVVNKYSTSGKETSYHLVLEELEGRFGEEFSVGWRLYNRVEPGRDRLRMVLRPGRLGHRWVEEFAPLRE